MTVRAKRLRPSLVGAVIIGLILALSTSVTAALPAQAVTTGTISGHISVPAETNNPNWWQAVWVEVTSDVDYYPTYLDSSGNFAITGLTPGAFLVTVHVDHDNVLNPVNLLTKKYNGGASLTVPAGGVANADVALDLGGIVSGTVTAPDGFADPNWWQGVNVEVHNSTDSGFTWLDSAGNYTVAGLTPGVYTVDFFVDGYRDDTDLFHSVNLAGTSTPGVTVATGATATVDAGLAPPVPFTTAPVPQLFGGNVVGSTLTAVRGTWSPTPTTITYQWYRNGKLIAGATHNTRKVTAADRGTTITVKVWGYKQGFIGISKTSAGKKIPNVFAKTVAPTVTGIASSGHTLTSHVGAWSPVATPFLYQWYRNGVKILGANMYWYKLTPADKGAKIVVAITGQKNGYLKVTRTSAPTVIAH